MIPIAGGVASFAEEGSPFNKVAGLGFGGVPSAAALDEIERAFAACGAPVQIELAHLADPAIGAQLTARGYRLVSFENVLGLALDGEAAPATPPGIEVRPSGDEEFGSWLDVVADGFAHPDTQGVPSHERVSARDPREGRARFRGGWRHALRRAARRSHRRRRQLPHGAGRRATHRRGDRARARRRGVQSALLSTRLAEAAAGGCDIAVVTTQPASKSQENVQRRGFDLLYTRAVICRGIMRKPDTGRADAI